MNSDDQDKSEEDFRAAGFDPDEVGQDGKTASGKFGRGRHGERSYRDWLRYLERLPTDELADRIPQTSTERRALQTLIHLELLSRDTLTERDRKGELRLIPNPLFDPETAIRTNTLISKETDGPPGSDMIPVTELHRWVRAVYSAAASIWGDDAPGRLNKAVRRKMTLTEQKLLPPHRRIDNSEPGETP